MRQARRSSEGGGSAVQRVELAAPVCATERLADHLAAGIVEHNARRRLQLVGYKLRTVPDTDYVLRRLRSDLAGSVSDSDRPLAKASRAAVLVACTVSMTAQRVKAWLSAADLVSLLDPAPEGLRQRLRSWVLAHAPGVDPVDVGVRSRAARSGAARPAAWMTLASLDRALALTDTDAAFASLAATLWAEHALDRGGRQRSPRSERAARVASQDARL